MHQVVQLNTDRYLREFVYGSIDGSVTTFAVVAGSAGGALSNEVIIILGFSNLLADGFSMSLGAYLSAKAENDNYSKYRLGEERAVRSSPQDEREEIRAAYRRKGFEGDLLERVVEQITSKEERWVDEMMTDELGMLPERKKAWRIGLVTFLAFILSGSIPLLVYIIDYLARTDWPLFLVSSILTACSFVIIGILKSVVNETGLWRGILETLMLGSLAAALAWFTGSFLNSLLGGKVSG